MNGMSWTPVAVVAMALAVTPVLGEEASSRLPTEWDPESGENVLWSTQLGTITYGGPVLAGDLVVVGTNNERPRDTEITGDRGVVMAFDREDGSFRWQVTHAKHPEGAPLDWPLQGVCSTPRFDGEHLYYVSNLAELVALDLAGETLWRLDMAAELGVVPRNMASSTPVLAKGRLYTLTSNGRSEEGVIAAPEAPSFLAVDAETGEVSWSSATPGAQLIEGQWASPTRLELQGRDQMVFPGGDGWLYSFDPESGEELWRFDGNSRLEGGVPIEERHSFVATAVARESRLYIAVGRDPEGPSAPGRLWALDTTGRGDVTESAVVWTFAGEGLGRSISTVALSAGVVYLSDLNGFVFALDEDTGAMLWKYDTFAAIWSSPLVADGKVYVADTDGEVAVLRDGRELEVLAEIGMPEPIHSSPVAAEGVLYVATDGRLWAISDQNGD